MYHRCKGAFDKLIVGSTAQNAWTESLSAESKAKLKSYKIQILILLNILLLKLIQVLQQEIQITRFLNAMQKAISGFFGGSADLGPSNKTELKDMGDFPNGKNIHFGIKEHAMAAMANAMNLYGLFRVYSATFLFSLII